MSAFLEDWGKCVVEVLVIIFGLFGTVYALYLAKDNWWLSVLIVVAVVLASGVYAHRKYRGEAKAKAQLHADIQQLSNSHKVECERLTSENRTALQRLTEAEKRINEIPLAILTQLQETVASFSYHNVAHLLRRRATAIARAKLFRAKEPDPLPVRTFRGQGDKLIAIMKVDSAALQYLEIGDPFILVRTEANGVEITITDMIVRQPPNTEKTTAYLENVGALTDDALHLYGLALNRDMAAMKGYSVRFAHYTTTYDDIDLTSVPDAIARLVEELPDMQQKVSND